ncbi:MAG: 4-hydroxy-3-methylbut-2-enyl diphosphate reductase, partial [Armatimonadota bacterium]
MRIAVVEEGGFCFGVRRAVKMAKEAAASDRLSATLGPLIHNPQVVEELQEQGIRVVESIEELEPGETFMIRAHGSEPDVLTRAQQRDLKALDATCPFVARAQQEARRLCDEGWQVLVLGDPGHPEARGIVAHTENRATIVKDAEHINGIELQKKAAVVSQTTQRLDNLQQLVTELLGRVRLLTVSNTICDATTQRQDASVAVAVDVDVMIVVGGYHSANTVRLAELCSEVNPNTHHVERASELKPE